MNNAQARIDHLNSRFSKAGDVAFEPGISGLTIAKLESGRASARLALLGATVISYVPAGLGEIFFLSRKSAFEPGKPIRGGIPVCWPWFGADPTGKGLPRHGFFRLFEWAVDEVSCDADESSIVLSLSDSEETRK